MLKKTITYVDYDGNERKEDFYFNLTKAEIMESELGVQGGLTALIERIITSKDTPSIVKMFKELILKSYGVKSPDGRRFIKNEELREEFSQTEAYSNLFMELSTDSKAGAAFINGIIPKDFNIDEEAKKEYIRKTLPEGDANKYIDMMEG